MKKFFINNINTIAFIILICIVISIIFDFIYTDYKSFVWTTINVCLYVVATILYIIVPKNNQKLF